VFERLARLVVAHRRLVIGGWIVAALAIVPFAPRLGDVTSSDESSFLPASYESAQALRLARTAFADQAGATAVLVFEREDGGRLSRADGRAIARVTRELDAAGLERVAAVRGGTAAQRSPDGRLELAQVRFDGGSGDPAVLDAAGEVRARGAALVTGSGLTAALTGEAAIKLDDRRAHATAEKTVGAATVTLILLLLLATFRSPVAALLPLLSIAVVFLLAGSLIALAARSFGFEVSLDLPPLLTVVLFGIGTDYVLFTLFRYRERLRAGVRDREAAVSAAAGVGRVITFAALVVAAAFAALGLSQLGSLRTMAPGLVIGVGLMWLAGVTLVPAVLSLLGPRVFWPSRSWQRPPRSTAYRRIGALVGRRPGRVAMASGGAMAALAVGALFYSASYDSIDQLPSGAESRVAFDQVRTSFPAGAITPTQVYVSGDEPIDRARLAALAASHRRPEGVASVARPSFSADGRTARSDVVLAAHPYSQRALDAVEGPIREAAHASGAGERVLVGGVTAASVDLRAATGRDYRLVFPVAALAIALLLGGLLRSFVAPLYLLGAVLLAFAAALGLTVAAFDSLLGQPGLKSVLPVILYLFVVAVGTDYSILITDRLREEARAGRSPREAAAAGLEQAGPAVASAGVILAGTFTSLLLTGIASLVQIGFAVSSGILIASFVMAGLLVPSLTVLVGERGRATAARAPAER
jgi:RND superfamily putative drug exporter